MGNDGGSIARRDELVKVKGAKPKQNIAQTKRIKWDTCRLSGRPLREPVVADALGRMYNKEAVVNYLIEAKVGEAKGVSATDPSMVHIKGLKDLTLLRLQPNDSHKSDVTAAATAQQHDDQTAASFSCPLTNRPMNGSHRFVYIATSGVVISESGLKSVLDPASTPASLSSCPVTSTSFQVGWLAAKAPQATSGSSDSKLPVEEWGDVIPLHPDPAEEEKLKKVMLKRKESRKTLKTKKAGKIEDTKADKTSSAQKRKASPQVHEVGVAKKRELQSTAQQVTLRP